MEHTARPSSPSVSVDFPLALSINLLEIARPNAVPLPTTLVVYDAARELSNRSSVTLTQWRTGDSLTAWLALSKSLRAAAGVRENGIDGVSFTPLAKRFWPLSALKKRHSMIVQGTSADSADARQMLAARIDGNGPGAADRRADELYFHRCWLTVTQSRKRLTKLPPPLAG